MINKEFEKLIIEIKNSMIYQNYLHILKQVEVNEDINILVNEIKNMQKQIVYAQSINQNIKELKSKLDSINCNLNAIPLYQSYIDASKEVDELMKLVSTKIQNCFNDLDI